jgi:C1A family cysteine protease
MPFATGHVRHPAKDHLIALSARRHARGLQALMATPLPASWDSRTLGWIGPIKDQSACGSCWDFSGTGMVEVAYNKAGVGGGAGQFILSEEYTLSCQRNGGCNGDDNVTVLDIAKSHGLPLTADYGPYTARPGTCNFKPQMTLYKIDDWGFADGSGGSGIAPVDAIKAAIMQYGCVGSAIAADSAFENISPGQVFSGHYSNINHDIILAGWDDAKGAWLLRNSWGLSFADQGYCWIKWGANQVGTEAVWCRINAAAPPIDYFI